jgi:glutaminyl-peptide cyclotransferase
MRLKLIWIFIFFNLQLFSSCNGSSTNNQSTNSISPSTPSVVQEPILYTYQIVNSWPHDPKAFTQGLVFKDGFIFESTGLNGSSSLRQVELETGRVIRKVNVPSEYFAEGLTLFQDKFYQLTWTSQKGFIYDFKSFQQIGDFSYNGEGWGLTSDDESLIMSDGSNQLRFLDPTDLRVKKVIKVFYKNSPLTNLNELEYIKGEVYANVWQEDVIVRLDPQSGTVLGIVDLRGLLPTKEKTDTVDVLNGIAYDSERNRIFVTGKMWPKIFEIQIKKK